jgi:hypothetical protein
VEESLKEAKTPVSYGTATANDDDDDDDGGGYIF